MIHNRVNFWNVIRKLEFFSLSCCQPDMGFYWARLPTDCSLAAGFGDVRQFVGFSTAKPKGRPSLLCVEEVCGSEYKVGLQSWLPHACVKSDKAWYWGYFVENLENAKPYSIALFRVQGRLWCSGVLTVLHKSPITVFDVLYALTC